jgi:hypothetical protein
MRFLQRSDRDVLNPEAWLIRAAGRSCQDVLRRRYRKRHEQLEAEPAAHGSSNPEDVVLSATLLRELFEGLRGRDAKILAGLYLNGWSPEQLAQEFKVSTATMRVMAMRARRRAARMLEGMGGASSAPALLPWAGDLQAWLRRRNSGARLRLQRLLDHQRNRGEEAGFFAWSSVAQLAASAAVVGLLTMLPGASLAAVQPVDHGAVAIVGVTPGGGHSASGPAAPGAAKATPSVAATGSRSAATTTVPGLLATVLAPAPNARQEDAGFTSITPSPNYSTDHTVFASGILLSGCSPACPVIFKSTDQGASWQRVMTSGFTGGKILLPASYATDPHIFALGSGGLQMSKDRGSSWTTIVPGASAAAVLPGGGPAPRVVVAVPALLLYDSASGILAPGPALPATANGVTDIAAVGSGLVVAADEVAPTSPGQQDSVLLACPLSGSCSETARILGASSLSLYMSPIAPATVVGLTDRSEYVLSRDGGKTYTALQSPSGGFLVTAMLEPRPGGGTALDLGIMSSLPAPANRVSLWRSTDLGHTFGAIQTSGLPSRMQISQVVALIDGRLIAAISGSDSVGDFGLRCSRDAGATWSKAC